jgi:dCTP deaminase
VTTGTFARVPAMILTRDVVLAEIAAGRVAFDPYDPDQVGPASVDLHLGDEIRVPCGPAEAIDVNDATDYTRFTELRRLDDPYVLAPGETIHGITRERVRLADDIAGWLEGRSRFARLGLMIHVTAGFVAPGVDARQVLEMSNVAGRPLVIHAGVRICQIVLQRCEGRAIYRGRFATQERP